MQWWLHCSLIQMEIAFSQTQLNTYFGIHILTMETLHPIYLASPSWENCWLYKPIHRETGALQLWGDFYFGSALQDCHYISGPCLSHCWWLTLHPAEQKETLCMVARRSLLWILFSALSLGRQFYHDSCKYWHLPGTRLCAFNLWWKGLMLFFWVCMDFLLALFFYSAFLWRDHKKEKNPIFVKISFFLCFWKH